MLVVLWTNIYTFTIITKISPHFNIRCFIMKQHCKITIGGLRLDQSLLQNFVAILNCKVMVTPFVYLGLPIGGCHKRGAFWSRVIESVQGKLSRWRGKCLSLVGRICLLKSVLSSIPLFVYVIV